MPDPNPRLLGEMTRKMVLEAGTNGTLSKLTPRVIREKLENELGMEDRALKPFKDVIQDAITRALGETGNDTDDDEADRAANLEEKEENVAPEVEQKKPVAKGKQKKATEKPPTKRPSKKSPQAETTTSSEAAVKVNKRKLEIGDEDTATKSKKVRVSSASKDAKEKDKKDKKAFTSAAVVPPSSDFEEEIPAEPVKDDLFSADEVTPRKQSSNELSSRAHLELISSPKNPLDTGSHPQPEEEHEKSESELSVLIDEPPKRKKGKAKEPSETNRAKEKKSKKGAASTTLSKDEETIKRLKSLVNACGVRKVWSKVFKDINDSPSKQISLLRQMLADLGMTGRLSLEQAKAIKEKRELASELADVQSFEQSMRKQNSRRSLSATTKESAEAGSERGSDEENIRPVKRRTNARQSIMAFLEDQSDSE